MLLTFFSFSCILCVISDMNTIQAADTVADAELVLDDLGLPGGLRALTDSCLVRIYITSVLS